MRTVVTGEDIRWEDARREAAGKGMYLYARKWESPPIRSADSYADRLLKYIPSEVIAVYLTVDAILKSATDMRIPVLWVVFLVLLVATPFYLWRVANIVKKDQIAISTLAFIVWVFAMGGPFISLSFYHPVYGAVALPLFTFLVPIYSACKVGAGQLVGAHFHSGMGDVV